MKHLRDISIVIASLLLLVSCHQSQGKKAIQEQVSQEEMALAFYHPVVQVDGMRMENTDPLAENPGRILVSYPQNSEHEITVRFLDSEGIEREIRGWIRLKNYTQHSKPEGEPGKIIDIDPDNAEDVYERIYRTGYGQLTIREYVDLELEEQQGPVLVQLELGSKKKSEGIEFRFREGIIHTVSGKPVPTSLSFPEDSAHEIVMTMDEGFVKLEGTLKVYKNNHYTRLAPVWVDFDETTRERLRAQGSNVQIALYVPSNLEDRDAFLTTLHTNDDPLQVGREKGTVVALLELKSAAGW